MDNQDVEKVKVAHYSWWICGILGLIIGLSSTDNSTDSGLMAFVGITNGLFWGWIIGLIIDRIRDSETVKTISVKISDMKDQHSNFQETKSSINEYNDAKNRYQYLSDETLLDKYKIYLVENESDITRLALEEELVKRNLLSHSPMHEKIDKIKNKKSDLEKYKDESFAEVSKYIIIAMDFYKKGENSPALLALETATKYENENIDANLMYCEIGLEHFGPNYIDEKMNFLKGMASTERDKFQQRQMKKLLEINNKFTQMKYKDQE